MENKKRMIDANRLVQYINADPYLTESEQSYVRCSVSRQPTVDAVEMVHGEWVIERSPVEAEFKCSECGYLYINADSYAKEEYNYCPNCGAKMDGERKDNE